MYLGFAAYHKQFINLSRPISLFPLIDVHTYLPNLTKTRQSSEAQSLIIWDYISISFFLSFTDMSADTYTENEERPIFLPPSPYE